MKTLKVTLGQRSYPIFIGERILQDAALVEPYVQGSQVLIVSNDRIAPIYMKTVMECFSKFRCSTLIIPDGERYKTLDTVSKIFDQLLEYRFERKCTLVALGGGVVGDVTGFAAACYQRGVDFIQVATTLLAQVDSSVGGKTGVNHPHGKNMIGAFHQPRCVVSDINTLRTLDDRQLSSGLAEVIKYGLISDSSLLEWLESHIEELVERSTDALTYVVEQSCRCKAAIVEADEKETDSRWVLNFGHTFGHAIEAGMGYGAWLHGEAVAVGMLQAIDLSARIGALPDDLTDRIRDLLTRARLPTRFPGRLSNDVLLRYVAVDKKSSNRRTKLVLLHDIGDAFLSDDVDSHQLRTTFDRFRSKQR